MSDTLVFIPAWNEEANLPAVIDGLRATIPDADVLVVDDGSTDRTADVAREHGAVVHSLGSNRGLRVGIAAGYRWALDHSYAYCGRVDADGQHPADELARLLALVRAGDCDVAVGSRFVSGDGYAPYRYRPSGPRRFGTAVLRRAMKLALGRPFGDATSGLYAVNAAALPLLAETFTSGQIAARLGHLPGAEKIFRRGVASRDLAEVFAGVGLDGAPPVGELTRETAEAVAAAARRRTGASHALAVLIDLDDGPDRIDFGGTICLAIATELGVDSRRSRILGGREWVRLGACEMGLDCLRRQLQGLPVYERIDFEKT